jgi:hypothetical protein
MRSVLAYDEAGEASVLGAALSVVDWLWVVESLGADDSVVVVDEPAGAVVPLLLLLPQAAALSAASPRASATSVFRIGYLISSVPWDGPVWVVRRAAPPGLGGTAPATRTVGEASTR